MRKLLLSCLLSFVVCFSASALTVNRYHAWIITPSVGAYHYADKRHVDNQAMPGLSLGYGLTQRISAELYLGRIITNQSRATKRDVKGVLYALDGFYHFRNAAAFQPYVLAGVGAMHLSPSTGNDADTEANINGGAGIAYFFSDQIALQLDGRDFYTIAGGKNDLSANFGVKILFASKQVADSQSAVDAVGSTEA